MKYFISINGAMVRIHARRGFFSTPLSHYLRKLVLCLVLRLGQVLLSGSKLYISLYQYIYTHKPHETMDGRHNSVLLYSSSDENN